MNIFDIFDWLWLKDEDISLLNINVSSKIKTSFFIISLISILTLILSFILLLTYILRWPPSSPIYINAKSICNDGTESFSTWRWACSYHHWVATGPIGIFFQNNISSFIYSLRSFNAKEILIYISYILLFIICVFLIFFFLKLKWTWWIFLFYFMIIGYWMFVFITPILGLVVIYNNFWLVLMVPPILLFFVFIYDIIIEPFHKEKFILTRIWVNKYQFYFKNNKGIRILHSNIFFSKSECLENLNHCKIYSTVSDNFRVDQAKNGQYYFSMFSENNEIMLVSNMFNKHMCDNYMGIFKKYSREANIVSL